MPRDLCWPASHEDSCRAAFGAALAYEPMIPIIEPRSMTVAVPNAEIPLCETRLATAHLLDRALAPL